MFSASSIRPFSPSFAFLGHHFYFFMCPVSCPDFPGELLTFWGCLWECFYARACLVCSHDAGGGRARGGVGPDGVPGAVRGVPVDPQRAVGNLNFQCPKCKLPQVLPPQLRSSQGLACGFDNTKIQLPCANCRAVLNVPPDLTRFVCPQCRVELAVDPVKLAAYMSSLSQLNALGNGPGM